jgi:hypothetical protein
MKICFSCKIEKEYKYFSKDKYRIDGYCSNCKECKKNQTKKTILTNEQIENKKKYQKKYIIKNKEILKEKKKEYYNKNKDIILKKTKEYANKNKDKINLRSKIYMDKKLKSNKIFKLKHSISSLIRCSFYRTLNGTYKKSNKTEEILGCTINEFYLYLQSLFKKNMNFENYGSWHIDHIIPVSSAKTEEEIIKLNHYTNLQPMWSLDNIKKSNKIIEKQLKLI